MLRPPSKLVKSPGSYPVDIQSHLYESFLQGSTTDITLHTKGSWEAIYKLHRVVLIQSGFFHSLFTGGFMESSLRGDPIEISFDDANITRAAFELSISRLYGGGPLLFISPALIPTPASPLTSSYPTAIAAANIPQGHHPATPRFLLSLLATALYLEIPSLAAQALNLILGSLGPHTVIQYLDFALGKPISPLEEAEPETVIGLEHIATIIRSSHVKTPSMQSTKEEITRPDDMSSRRTSHSSCDDDVRQTEIGTASSHYGNISNKIGEACVVWLARWTDILPLEVEVDTRERNGTTNSNDRNNVPVIWGRGGLSARWVSALVCCDVLYVRSERERYDFARTVVELRRARGIDPEEESVWSLMFSEGIYYQNLSFEDITAISTDISLITQQHFVPLSTLQNAHWCESLLRHQITSKPKSEASPSFLFSPHSSPTPSPSRHTPSRSITGPPILPVSLRPRATSPLQYPVQKEAKELGITSTTAEILNRISSLDPASAAKNDRPYFLVVSDGSLRLGDNGGIQGESMRQLFEVSSLSKESNEVADKGQKAAGEASFFGLRRERYSTAAECIAADASGKSQWTPYPPFRFSVEFWDVASLKEKSRLYSHTVAYAGSFWNVYVQVVRKKGVQLGVYIHRQSSIDPIPPASAPSNFSNKTDGEDRNNNYRTWTPSSPHFSPSIHPPSRSLTPVTLTPGSPPPSSSAFTSSTSPPSPYSIPATSPPVTPYQAFRDPRAAVSAYFTVSVTSLTGASLTKFMSSPDVFSVSQSWGWKSSTIRTEEYIDTSDAQSEGASNLPADRIVSLRATVVLGLV